MEIDYVAGDPVAVDGKKMKPVALAGASQITWEGSMELAGSIRWKPIRGHEVRGVYGDAGWYDSACGASRPGVSNDGPGSAALA